MKYSDQVMQVKTILAERWIQGKYFDVKDDKMCCCVHGAAQYVCNPKVRDIIKHLLDIMPGTVTSSTATFHLSWARAAALDAAGWAEAGAPARAAALASASSLAFAREAGGGRGLDLWKARPRWVEADNLNLHYLLGMFGLTAVFNDMEETTLTMLNDRLDECAAWAAQNEDFLASN